MIFPSEHKENYEVKEMLKTNQPHMQLFIWIAFSKNSSLFNMKKKIFYPTN